MSHDDRFLQNPQASEDHHHERQLKGEAEPHQHLQNKIGVARHRPTGLQAKPLVEVLKKPERLR